MLIGHQNFFYSFFFFFPTLLKFPLSSHLVPNSQSWVSSTKLRRPRGLLPGKSHGWRSLVSCSPWGREESDTTEWLHFHFSLTCIGEGNGNPLQCSCLENPRDGGAWWTAVYGVAQSRTRLKQLSSSWIQSLNLQHESMSDLWLYLTR